VTVWVDSPWVLSDWLGFQHPRQNDDDCFYDFKSSLVLLIDSLCSSDSNSWVYVHIFCFSFRKKKMFQKKSSSRSHPASQQIYTHVYFVHIYEHNMPRFSPSGFFGPSRCLVTTPGLTSEYPMCSVSRCVFVYTHIHQHTFQPASKNRGDRDNTRAAQFF